MTLHMMPIPPAARTRGGGGTPLGPVSWDLGDYQPRARTAPVPARDTEHRGEDLRRLARRPWRLRADGTTLTIRPSTPRDLPAVVAMHRRCSGPTLLDRYRAGGRAPAPIGLETTLRMPLSFVAAHAEAGTVIATALVAPNVAHGARRGEIAILVEDAWQRIGIGRELMTHLAGVARVAGFAELIAFPGESVLAAQRLMIDIGRTRMVPDPAGCYLITPLPDDAALGVGAVRERLVG